ncbi:STAS domain-containing protein [Streptomyces gobitricini]|uniref:STAS domain-containing protein n=1 Tax=Streptomyces gobitricini TaxID=68211 RepID=A0ABP5YWQ7_9ACTN
MDTTDPKVFRVVGLVEPADVPRLCEELTELLGGSGGGSGGEDADGGTGGRSADGTPGRGATGTAHVVCDVGGVARPGLTAVDALARLRLTAGRLGHRMAVQGAGPELRMLLELVGLADLLLTPPPPPPPPAAPGDRTAGTSASRPGRT